MLPQGWCRSHCCSWAIVAVLVGMRWLGLRRGQCLCLAAGSLSLRILPAFLGQASPPLLSANAGTAHSRARLWRNLSTPWQWGQLSHPIPPTGTAKPQGTEMGPTGSMVSIPSMAVGSSGAAYSAWVPARGGSRASRAIPSLTFADSSTPNIWRGQVPAVPTSFPQSTQSLHTLPFPAAPAAPLQLSPKLKPLAFPVQTFPINK